MLMDITSSISKNETRYAECFDIFKWLVDRWKGFET